MWKKQGAILIYLHSISNSIAAQKLSMNSMRFEMFSIDVTLKFYPANQACGLFWEEVTGGNLFKLSRKLVERKILKITAWLTCSFTPSVTATKFKNVAYLQKSFSEQMTCLKYRKKTFWLKRKVLIRKMNFFKVDVVI